MLNKFELVWKTAERNWVWPDLEGFLEAWWKISIEKNHFLGGYFKDAASVQTLASFIFIYYFACLTPIVNFGGLLGDATGN